MLGACVVPKAISVPNFFRDYVFIRKTQIPEQVRARIRQSMASIGRLFLTFYPGKLLRMREPVCRLSKLGMTMTWEGSAMRRESARIGSRRPAPTGLSLDVALQADVSVGLGGAAILPRMSKASSAALLCRSWQGEHSIKV